MSREKTEKVQSSIFGAIRDFNESEALGMAYDAMVALTARIMASIQSTIKTESGNVVVKDYRTK